MSGHHRNIVPKTVVIKKIERRTPYGKLLSVVNVKSTYYDGELVDIPEESTSRISTPTTKVISTRPQSRRHQYNQRIFDESPGERTEYVLTGKNTNMFSDSTLYGDDWSSSGITQVRESHLVRSASQSVCNTFDEYVIALERINCYRKFYDRPVVSINEHLLKEAKAFCYQQLIKSDLTPHPLYAMNIWTGSASFRMEDIIDEWFNEMKLWQTKSNFANERFRYVGLSHIRLQRNGQPMLLVVCLYD